MALKLHEIKTKKYAVLSYIIAKVIQESKLKFMNLGLSCLMHHIDTVELCRARYLLYCVKQSPKRPR